MKYIFSLFFLFGFIINSYGQTYIIKGSVADTLNNVPLQRASVIVMRTNDSGIVANTRSDAEGKFELKVVKEGKYILRISFVSFADYMDIVNVHQPKTDIGSIPMISREHLLTEFVITQQIGAIKIKGDTTEYMADSFKVKEGANVEDLLRRLPGIQVDKNGKITAQGETVQKILVDGEEFFSDDPKVVTQGLQAGIVNKVQVYDKKSDQAQFTGVDDGERTKTINLEIKESKKKGYFGKLDAGGGTDNFYQNQAMINAFKGKRQVSAFGIASNTDKVGLDWTDNDKFGGGGGITEITDNGYSVTIGGTRDEFGGWSGTYSGQGLPSVLTGGLHFTDKWNEDKNHVSGSYRYALQNVNVTGDNIAQYSMAGDTSRINTEHKTQSSKTERHGFNGFYEWKIDSNSSIRFTIDGVLKNNYAASNYHTETYNIVAHQDGLKTSNDRLLSGNTNDQKLNSDLLYRKKFAKKGRTFSLDIKENYKDTKGTGLLYSTVVTPDTSGKLKTSITNQRKTDSIQTLAFAVKATYTEPLSKRVFLEIDYGLTLNNSMSKKFSFDKDTANNKYDIRNDSFSSNYKYNILSNQGGINFRYDYKKINFSFGSEVSGTNYLQSDLMQSELLHRDFTTRYNYLNLYPSANFTYKIGRQTSINFYYNGSTKQPNISQIQPLNQNTDPLNVMLGNPDLKQQFTNRIRFNFRDYKVLSHRYFYVGGSASSDIDAISTAQTTNGAYSSTKYININGNYSANWWVGYNFKIKKPDIDVRLSIDGGQGHSRNMVNNLMNTNNNNSYSFGTEFSKYKEDKYNFGIEPKITYNLNRSTISTYTTNYWEFNNDIYFDVELPHNFNVGSVFNAMIREKTVAFPANNDVIKWNAYVSKKMMKKKLEVKATLFDILNQNTGFSRSASASIITQSNYNTVRRYAMLSLIWNFTHTPGAAVAVDEKK